MKDKLASKCRPCKNTDQLEYIRKYRAEHPEMYSPEYMRKWHLANKYGITMEEYDRMLDSQGGRCAVCNVQPNEAAFHVDHDHACCPGVKSCGKCIRGILCRNCNVALGFLKDSGQIIKNMLNYIGGIK
jgi:hypothetical protein